MPSPNASDSIRSRPRSCRWPRWPRRALPRTCCSACCQATRPLVDPPWRSLSSWPERPRTAQPHTCTSVSCHGCAGTASCSSPATTSCSRGGSRWSIGSLPLSPAIPCRPRSFSRCCSTRSPVHVDGTTLLADALRGGQQLVWVHAPGGGCGDRHVCRRVRRAGRALPGRRSRTRRPVDDRSRRSRALCCSSAVSKE